MKVTSTDHLNYIEIENEIHPLRKHFSYAWIKQYLMNLGRLGDQGAEANHASYCVRISFGGYMEPVEQVMESIKRSQDISLELYNKCYEQWQLDTVKAASWRSEGRDNTNISALLALSPDGFKIWQHCKSESVYYTIVQS